LIFLVRPSEMSRRVDEEGKKLSSIEGLAFLECRGDESKISPGMQIQRGAGDKWCHRGDAFERAGNNAEYNASPKFQVIGA